MTESLKIYTFNVNGLGDKVKRKAIFQNIRDKEIDIMSYAGNTQHTPDTSIFDKR